MKKYIYFIILICTGMFIIKCSAPKRTEYIVPAEYTGEARKNLITLLDMGQKLFKLKCSPCHGIFTKGKDSIPNFSKTQIEAYRSAALLDDPKNHSVAQKIRPEDLDMILLFLEFRKQAIITENKTAQ